MATGAIGSAHTTTTEAGVFIPELWSDEVIAGYKKNLVLANLVTVINHKGKKGDQIHIPAPVRGSATSKSMTGSAQVKIQTDTHLEKAILLDKHYEYSVMIQDIVEVQALSSMRKFYTEDAGYALATQVDTDLFNEAAYLNAGSGVTGASGWDKAQVFDANGVLSNWDRSGTGDAISLATGGDNAIRGMLEKLDLADVPADGRAFILTPRQYTDLLGINRFTEQQFIGSGDAIKTGKVGMIYGVDVYVTNNMGTTQAATGSVVHDIGLLIHKGALGLVEQMSVRSQTQYMQEYLGDLFTADTIYGVGELRDTSGFAFVTDR
jgi:N4-gp56 family major capsid protein